jgi:hypothetical protein
MAKMIFYVGEDWIYSKKLHFKDLEIKHVLYFSAAITAERRLI